MALLVEDWIREASNYASKINLVYQVDYFLLIDQEWKSKIVSIPARKIFRPSDFFAKCVKVRISNLYTNKYKVELKYGNHWITLYDEEDMEKIYLNGLLLNLYDLKKLPNVYRL